MEALRERKIWGGTLNDLSYEIAFWGEGTMNEGHGMWNYYIYVYDNQLSPEDFALLWLKPKGFFSRSSGIKIPRYPDYESIFGGLPWHGGITAYSKHSIPDTNRRWVKAGCDYGHAFDMDAGYFYDLDYVRREAIETVRVLLKQLRFKRRCCYTGKWIYEENGEYHNDRFYSPSGWRKSEAWRQSNTT